MNCVIAVYSTAVNGPNLREGAFPWAASSGCFLAALVIAALAGRHDRTWGSGPRVVANVTTWALVGVAAFFAGLGTEDLLHQALGTPRILSGSELITALGTLSASLLTIVVVPAGTFRVVGQVIEEDTSNLPVGGVRVETISGASGNSTDLNGQYRLYGVPPPRICVSARTDI